MNKVKVGNSYWYNPVAWDIVDPKTDLTKGENVKVVNLPMAPKANTMKHCYVARPDGKVAGLVHVASLTKEKPL